MGKHFDRTDILDEKDITMKYNSLYVDSYD